MATLRDVAKLSGVSPATVSHVLNNRTQEMSAETRQRVLDAMRTLGYRPGIAPTGASSRHTHTIGVFIWLEQSAPLRSNPYAVNILDGILVSAMPNHWNVTLISVNAWEDARSQVRLYADGRCDGFVLIAPPAQLAIPEALQERGYPFVLVNAGSDNPAVDSVDIDNAAAAHELTTHLLDQGHRHIAFLPGSEAYDNTSERLRGFRQAFADAGLPDPDTEAEGGVLRPGEYHYEQSAARVTAFLERRVLLPPAERPTALLCGNDKLAWNAREVMRQYGVSVPGDISLAGFDDAHYAAEMDPPLTTVRQPLHEIGARATELLLARITGADTAPSEPVTTFLPYEIVMRSSVR
jgi:DNA-binding LacI/PurR family transcriptional regulator